MLPLLSTCFAILLWSTVSTFRVTANSNSEDCELSLWERLGGEDGVRPLVEEIYKLHVSDPLTKDYFGPHKFSNNGNAQYVIDQVFNFFSAGIGGPHEYTGKSMSETHVGMKISQTAFHALTGHVTSAMKAREAGGPREREEVLSILYSLKSDVMSRIDEDGKLSNPSFIEFNAE